MNTEESQDFTCETSQESIRIDPQKYFSVRGDINKVGKGEAKVEELPI